MLSLICLKNVTTFGNVIQTKTDPLIFLFFFQLLKSATSLGDVMEWQKVTVLVLVYAKNVNVLGNVIQ